MGSRAETEREVSAMKMTQVDAVVPLLSIVKQR